MQNPLTSKAKARRRASLMGVVSSASSSSRSSTGSSGSSSSSSTGPHHDHDHDHDHTRATSPLSYHSCASYSERRTTPWKHKEVIVNGIRMHYVDAEPARKMQSPLPVSSSSPIQGSSKDYDIILHLRNQHRQPPPLPPLPPSPPPPSPPLIVLLHGFPEFWYAWRFQIAAFVASGYRVVAPDLRGYNLTEKPSSGYTLNALSEDIRQLILHLLLSSTSSSSSLTTTTDDTKATRPQSRRSAILSSEEEYDTITADEEQQPLSDDSANKRRRAASANESSTNTTVYLMGHDWGGVIASAVAARFPELVSKLILLQAPHLAALEQTRLERHKQQQHCTCTTTTLPPPPPPNRIHSIGAVLSCCPPIVPEVLLGYNRSWLLSYLFFQSNNPLSCFCSRSSSSSPTADSTSAATETTTARPPSTLLLDEEALYRDAMSQPGAITCMLAYFRNLKISSVQSRSYGKIQCPVLVLWWVDDHDDDDGGDYTNINVNMNGTAASAVAQAHAKCLQSTCTLPVELRMILPTTRTNRTTCGGGDCDYRKQQGDQSHPAVEQINRWVLQFLSRE